MLKLDEITKFARIGLAFKELVTGLPVLQSAEDEGFPAVDARGILANLTESYPDLAEESKRLDFVTRDMGLTSAEVRLAAARIIARWKLDLSASHGIPDSESLAHAKEEFGKKDMLKSSAVDIVATAILLPDDTFVPACDGVNHVASVLASQFDVPVGVVRLKQHLLDCNRDYSLEPSD